jgi:imidazole glycerol-phosphate synthase subunit HisH
MKKTVTVIDYGMGNLFNLLRALELIECEVKITSNFVEVIESERVIIPGVGAFENGIKDLKENNLNEAIKEFATTGKPLLGICLGMQLLMTCSEEDGFHDGLGLIMGTVQRFKSPNDNGDRYKIPQIGWNELSKTNKKLKNKTDWGNSILKGLNEKTFMYFLHSYYVLPKDDQICLAETSYGQDIFCSVFQQDQIFGCQFHPERSSKQGLMILKNFLDFN